MELAAPAAPAAQKAIIPSPIRNIPALSADKSGLSGGSVTGSPAPTPTQFGVQSLQLCPAPVGLVAGSGWNTDTLYNDDHQWGGWEYPDVSTFSFISDSITEYERFGVPYATGVQGESGPLMEKYWQYGCRVYFYGLDENYGYLIPYFGVLTPDGNTMYVDTDDFGQARLPYYAETYDTYGPIGVTPGIHKLQ